VDMTLMGGRPEGSGQNDPKTLPHVGRMLERSDSYLVCENYLQKLADLTENASWSAI
jgi:hypothetical protein